MPPFQVATEHIPIGYILGQKTNLNKLKTVEILKMCSLTIME